MANLVYPDYQVALLRSKQSLGKELSSEELKVIEAHPKVVLNKYLEYLKQKDPQKFEEILNNLKLTPIKNFRENYNLAQMFLIARKNGLLSQLPKSEEVFRFNSSFSTYRNMNYFYFFGTWASLAVFNVAFAVPRFTSIFSLLVQNASLWFILNYYSKQANENNWKLVIPHLSDASSKYSTELKNWQKEGKILYQYEKAEEDFTPDEYKEELMEYLSFQVLYDEAHSDDFESTGRRHSQFVHGKDLKNLLTD
jgi:hypothetical protein